MDRFKRSSPWLAGMVLGGWAMAAPALAEPLTERLIALRSEVEQLNSELELLREEQRSTLAGLNAQQAELRASADRQQLAAAEARRKLDEARATAQAAGASSESLKAPLLQAIDALVAQIQGGLPFKIEERLAELQQFRGDVDAGTLPVPRAVNRLWAFYEDEFRLTRDNSLHAQTLQIGSERVLADVAKIGSMALYFRTQDGRLGRALVDGGRWQFVVEADEQRQGMIRALFDALDKQIRQGYFELPLAATGVAP